MIENNGRKYYTALECVELINDESTEIHKVWEKKYPNYQNIVLLDQVNRILYEAKKLKKISFVEYTKTEKSNKKYFAFQIDEVIEYISTRDILKQPYNLNFIDKE